MWVEKKLHNTTKYYIVLLQTALWRIWAIICLQRERVCVCVCVKEREREREREPE